jgi:pimeloyl-ACP methyl ester carboxylesterase
MPDSKFMTVRDVRLHHLDYGGDGPPIVLVHGVAGSAWMWDAVAPPLAAHGRVLALDLRGYGDSEWDPDHEYTTESHAADVAAWLDAQGLTATRFLGFSWGGLIGLHLASIRPELVERLAMIDIPPSFTAAETEIPPLPLEFAALDEALAAERRQNRFAAPELLETLARNGTRPAPDGRLLKKHDTVFAERWPFRRDDRWDELGRLVQPLLLVRGAESMHVSERQAELMVRAAPHARLAEVERTGHLIPVDNPADLTPILSEFVALKGTP